MKPWLRWLSLGCLAAAVVTNPTVLHAAGSNATPAVRRNIVLIVADDLGLELGCFGDRVAKTPHIDAFAAAGVRFNYAFCTTASCSASRSVILTGLQNHANGQFGHQHGYNDFHTHEFVRGLPVLLGEAGYRTCSIGKLHVQPEKNYHFDQYANDGAQGGRNPVRMAENAERFIREADPRPFFIYFCPTDPHRAAKGFANDQKHPGVNEVKYDPRAVPVPHFLPDQPEVREELAEYYQAVSRVDQGVGRLVQALQDTQHWDDTLVLFLSDNGIAFPGAKTTLYEPGMHLPLIVRDPQSKRPGSVSNAMITWADLTPTILEYTGAKGPKYPLHGRSFLAALERPDLSGWDEILASHTFHEITMYYPMRVIRTRKYKYILNLAHQLPYPFASDLYESPTWQGVLRRNDKMLGSRSVEAYVHRPRHELYDLENDPRELVNLAEKPELAETLKELQTKLQTWQDKTDDPWIVKYRYE